VGDATMSVSAPVRLVLAPEYRYLRLARLTASALAVDLDFGVDEIDDLKLAIDELCTVLVDEARGPLELVFTTTDDGVIVDGSTATRSTAEVELHPIAEELLSVVVDSYHFELSDGERSFHLERRQRPSPT
jgi:serine/threonine-protein kinase RsbW